tara:strand:+ start:983 stop:1855 length:873 start_codon:yes stop_codon:yes gene_type:complete
MNNNHIKQSPMLTLPGMGGGSNSPLVRKKASSGPYKDVDATSVECFWDGASDQISGTVWNSKRQHPNLSNANITMSGSSYTSSVTGGDGSIGYWSFDGVDDYGWINDLNYGSSGSHGPSNNGQLTNFTMGTWFKTSYGTPNSSGTWDNQNWSWLDWDRSEVISWNIGTAGKLQFSGYSNNGGYLDITGNGTYNNGQWHFGVCTVSSINNQIKFYGDGQPDGTHSYSYSYFGAGSRRWGIIGDGSEATANNGQKNSFWYNGDIAQQFLINEVWTDAKVLAHFTKTRSRFGV